MIKIVLTASTHRAEVFWQQGGVSLQRWFSAEELKALAPRKNRAEATMARLLGKSAVRAVLRRAGMRNLPTAKDLCFAVDPSGRPWVDMPKSCADWLVEVGLGLDISLSHTRERVLAVAVLA